MLKSIWIGSFKNYWVWKVGNKDSSRSPETASKSSHHHLINSEHEDLGYQLQNNILHLFLLLVV